MMSDVTSKSAGYPPPERLVVSIFDSSSFPEFVKALNAGAKHQVRAAGNIRVLLFGSVGRLAPRKPTRPVATGTFAFPAFGAN